MSDCTGLYVNWVAPLTTLFHVIVLGVATGAISLFLTKSSLLNSMHDWLDKKLPLLGEMLNCPWCTSHWIALFFTLVYRPLLLDWGWRPMWVNTDVGLRLLNFLLTPVDYLVTVMVMVTIASLAARLIWSAYKPIMS